MRKKYNTPHRSRVVKTRLSEDEYADFTARLAPYGISQSEFSGRRYGARPYAPLSMYRRSMMNCSPLSGSWPPSTAGSAATSIRLPGI